MNPNPPVRSWSSSVVARAPVTSGWTAYTLTIGIVAVCVGVRYLLDPWMGGSLPLVTLFGAIAAAAWLGGYRPALIATLAGYIACAFLYRSSS